MLFFRSQCATHTNGDHMARSHGVGKSAGSPTPTYTATLHEHLRVKLHKTKRKLKELPAIDVAKLAELPALGYL